MHLRRSHSKNAVLFHVRFNVFAERGRTSKEIGETKTKVCFATFEKRIGFFLVVGGGTNCKVVLFCCCSYRTSTFTLCVSEGKGVGESKKSICNRRRVGYYLLVALLLPLLLIASIVLAELRSKWGCVPFSARFVLRVIAIELLCCDTRSRLRVVRMWICEEWKIVGKQSRSSNASLVLFLCFS